VKLKQVHPLTLMSNDQFRPDGPSPLTSGEYAEDAPRLLSSASFAISHARADDEHGRAVASVPDHIEPARPHWRPPSSLR
jgi:hypothetical protein